MQLRLPTFATNKKPISNRPLGLCLLGLLPLMTLETTLAETTDVSLPEAIELTLEQHPQLAVWSARQAELQAQASLAASKERVVLDLSVEDALGTGDYSGISSAQTTLAARWLLENEQRQARVQRAQIQRDQADLKQQLETLELSAATARYFVQLLATDAQLALAKEAESEIQDLMSIVQRRVDSGRAPDIELHQVKTRLAERALVSEEFEHQRVAASYQLSSQWAASSADLRASADLYKLPALPTEADVLARLDDAPLLQQYTVRHRLLAADSQLAKAEAQPQWTVGAGVRRFEANGDFALLAQASIPFGLDQKRVAYQRVVKAQQQTEAQAAVVDRNRLAAHVRVLLLELQHSQHLIHSLNNNILPELDQARQQALNAWQRGQLDYQQWDGIRQQRLEARERLLNEYLAMQLQWIELQRLTGSSFSL